MSRRMRGAVAAVMAACIAAATYDPIAADEAIVHFGNARFTVLKDAVVRMEYSPSAAFDDTATLAVLHRRFTVPDFSVSTEDDVLTIRTRNVEIVYDKADDGRFNNVNLRAKLLVHPYSSWTPGSPNDGNLHGTIRTLDRVYEPVSLRCPFAHTNFMVYYSHCEEGLVSRDGWVVVDDTLRPRVANQTIDLPTNDGTPAKTTSLLWPQAPNSEAISKERGYLDLYLFAHGHDYKKALGDFVSMSGPIPLSPRYALGPAFSRWFQWSDVENTGIALEGFADNGIPLDTLVVDMDWHYTHSRGVQGIPNPANVRVEGWTGHTTYPYLFPDPTHFMAYLKRRGVAVTFNHHPAGGVEFHEAAYANFSLALGKDPSTGETREFDVANLDWMVPYFREVIKPIDDTGMQYWWLDFQQQPFTTVPLLNPTIMCNHAWYTNPYRYGPAAPPAKAADRPYVMGRFGGLGAHRYPIGFVGDTYVRWSVLRYESFFMASASNVGFAWTHDIGGFEGPSPPEFFTRHLQFGTFSPALRTHSSKRSPARTIWTYPQPYFAVMRRFYRLRARLVPYVASMQRIAYESGVQVVRPMYYEWPECSRVYTDQGLHQYYFGEDIWMAPIAAPAPNSPVSVPRGVGQEPVVVQQPYYNVSGAGVTPWTFWLPPGKWMEWFSFQAMQSTPYAGDADEACGAGGGGVYVSRNYSIAEVPLFSRPGAIIPMRTLQAQQTPGRAVHPHPRSGDLSSPSSGIGGARSGGVLGLASLIPDDLTFTVFGGVDLGAGAGAAAGGSGTGSEAGSGTVTTRTRVYDDDGATVAYEQGHYAWTNVSCDWRRGAVGDLEATVGVDGWTATSTRTSTPSSSQGAGDGVTCTVHPIDFASPHATIAGLPSTRTYTWRFAPMYPPHSIAFNGAPLARDPYGAPDANGENAAWEDPSGNAWGYDAASLSLWVHIGAPQPIDAPSVLTLKLAEGLHFDDEVLTSTGLPRIVSRVLSCKDEVDRLYGMLFPSDIEPLLNVTAAITRINAAADGHETRRHLSSIRGYLSHAHEAITAWRIPPIHFASIARQRCLAAINDALALPTALPDTHPAAIAADGPIQFKFEVGEHLTAPEPPLHEVYPDGMNGMPVVPGPGGQ